MVQTLDTELLSSMLKSKRGKKSLREISVEIGNVSYVTLSRIEQGKVPDVDTFIRICKWLNVSTDSFVVANNDLAPANVSAHDVVIAHLRADRELEKDTVEMLVKMVNLAYSQKTPN